MDSSKIFAAMQNKSPYKSYIKTILGKVHVTILDPYNETEVFYSLLYGNPRGTDKERCIVDVWSEKQDVFFQRMNERHFQKGRIIPYTREAEKTPVKEPVQFSDDELLKKLSERFFAIKQFVESIDEPVVLFRLIDIAKENEKSEKIVTLVEARLAEVQQAEYSSDTQDTEEEV